MGFVIEATSVGEAEAAVDVDPRGSLPWAAWNWDNMDFAGPLEGGRMGSGATTWRGWAWVSGRTGSGWNGTGGGDEGDLVVVDGQVDHWQGKLAVGNHVTGQSAHRVLGESPYQMDLNV